MLNNTVNFVSPSLLDIENKFKEIQKMKLNLSDDFLDTGVFGYINQANAVMLRDSILHRSSIYNESFLNTAIIPQSIYNWAKLFNVNVVQATPSYTDIQFVFNQDDLIAALDSINTQSDSYNLSRYGEIFTGKYLVIDRNYPIIIGDNIHFYLEKSILITKVESSASTNYITARYLKNESITTNYNKGPDYLKIESKSGQFIIHARVYQYKIIKSSKNITDGMTNILSRVHNFEFDEQFVTAKLYYIKNNIKREIPLYYGTRPISSAAYATYNIINENEIQIKFDNKQDSFVPEPNSTIEVHIYTTRGSNINSKLNGIGSYSVDSTNLNQSLFLSSFSVVFNDYIKGGVNVPSLSDIKQTIISEISTRKVLITEDDLNLFFGQLSTTLKHIANSEVRFVKKRDDVLKRVFDTYLLLRYQPDINNYLGECIPTNTVSADFPISSNASKPAGSIIIRKEFDDGQLGYEYSTEIIDSNKDYYVIPFYTRIILDPINVVKYVYNVCDDSSSLEYKGEIRNKNIYITPLDVSVKRGMTAGYSNSNYVITVRFQSDIDLSKEFGDKGIPFKLNILNLKSTVLESITFNSGDTTIINKTEDDDSSLYEFEVSISLRVDEEEFHFDEKNTLNDYGTYIKLKTPQNQPISLPEEVLLEFVFDIKKSNFEIRSTFKTTTKVSLFKNLDDIMFSELKIRTKDYYINYIIEDEITTEKITTEKPDGVEGQDYIKKTIITSVFVENIPVIHSSFFNTRMTEDQQSMFIKQMFAYIDMLRENLHRLENTTFFNLKFFNTYGISYRTSSPTTNVSLRMKIYFSSPEYNTDRNKSEIKYAIRQYIDNCNKEGEFSPGNLVAYLKNTFNIISKIEKVSLNNQGDTSIIYLDDFQNTTMEWINIQSSELDEGIEFDVN